MKVGFATCREHAQLIPGDQLLLQELITRGHEARPVIWDADEDIKQFDCLLIRSTWDYSWRMIEFLKWIDLVAESVVKLFNPPQIIRWSSNKLYLRELESNGVTIPETEWIPAGVALNLTSILTAHKWTRAVVKPVISAGGRATYLFDEAQAFEIEKKLRKEITCDLIVQEFLPEIQDPGEYSLIFFNGNYSHAILKTPAKQEFRVQSRHGGSYQLVHPSINIIRQAALVLSRIPFSSLPLYARVDFVLRDGRLILCELELLEPDLYLEYDPSSAARMADTLLLSV
jgi:glutathione synthase/RimK-type ligase-like ATP-grasp enzyme